MSYPSEAEIRRIYEEKRRKSRFPSNRRRSITQEQLEFGHDSAEYELAMYNQEQSKVGSPPGISNTQPAPSGTIPGTTGNPSVPTAGGSSPVSSGSPSSGGRSRRNDGSKNTKQPPTADSSGEDASDNDDVSELYGYGYPYWYAYGFDPISGGLYNTVSDSNAVSDERTVLDNFLGTFSEDISPGEIDTLTTLFDVFPLQRAESIVADSREVSVEEKTVIANYLGISAAQRAVGADVFGVSSAQRMTPPELLDINVGSDELDNIVFGHLDSVIQPIIDGLQLKTADQILAHSALRYHLRRELRVPARSLTGYLFNRPTGDHLAQWDAELNARTSNQPTGILAGVDIDPEEVRDQGIDAINAVNTVVKNTDTEHIGNTAQHIGILASHAANARGIRTPNFNSIFSGVSAAGSQLSNAGAALGMAGFVADGTAGKSLNWTIETIEYHIDLLDLPPTPLTPEELAGQGISIFAGHQPGSPQNIKIRENAGWYIRRGDSFLEAAKDQIRTLGEASVTGPALMAAYEYYQTAIDILPPLEEGNLRSRMDEVNELLAVLGGE